jgi:hypothetical protein
MPPLEPPAEQSKDPKSWASLPTETVFAVFQNRSGAEAAKERLLHAGIAQEQIQILAGPEGAERLDPTRDDGAQPNLLERAAAQLTDHTTKREAYARNLREGLVLIAVGYRAETKEATEEARMTIEAILIDAGGLDLSYTSDWTLTVVGGRKRPE